MADFYGTVAGYKAWADARGTSYSGKTDAQIEQALVRASEYIDGAYAWPGSRTDGRSQVRQWPRAWVIDTEGYGVPSDSVPTEVTNATYEGTARELVTAGALSKDVKPGGGVIRRVKAGSTEVEFQPNAATQTTFTRIDQALAPLIGGQSSYSGAASRA